MNKAQAHEQLMKALNNLAQFGDTSTWEKRGYPEVGGVLQAHEAYKEALVPAAPKTVKADATDFQITGHPNLIVNIPTKRDTDTLKKHKAALVELIQDAVRDFEKDYAPINFDVRVNISTINPPVKADATATAVPTVEGIDKGDLTVNVMLNAPLGLPGCRVKSVPVLIYDALIAHTNQDTANEMFQVVNTGRAVLTTDGGIVVREGFGANKTEIEIKHQPEGDVDSPSGEVDEEPARIVVSIATATATDAPAATDDGATDGAEIAKTTLQYTIEHYTDGDKQDEEYPQTFTGLAELKAALIAFRSNSPLKWKSSTAVRDLRAGMFPATYTIYTATSDDGKEFALKVKGEAI